MRKLSLKHYIMLSVAVVALAALIMFAMGRIPICKCGFVKFWHGEVFSSQNSQHLTDWYTFSHIIHGFAFYFLFWLIGRKYNWPIGLRLLLAVVVEVGWEVFENTDMVINRYREVTISLDYYGDSIINSVFDMLAMAVGFVMAYKLPAWLIIFLTVAMEVIVGYYIRDNLTLNIIMLVYPNDAILNWQAGK